MFSWLNNNIIDWIYKLPNTRQLWAVDNLNSREYKKLKNSTRQEVKENKPRGGTECKKGASSGLFKDLGKEPGL